MRNLFGGEVISYASGLSAFLGMIIFLNPKRVFVGDGYHGVHGALDIMEKLNGMKKLTLKDLDQLQAGDVVHVETPLNPTGEARNLEYYKKKAQEAGAYLTVDATFGPPPLQNPLKQGADIIMHSGTKYIGGHSDMLCGILVVNPERREWVEKIRQERMVLGNVPGSFEGWLGIRSLRTMHLRVTRQSQTASQLVAWMRDDMKQPDSIISKTVERLEHASLQEDDLNNGWLQKQMPGGFGPVFAMWFKRPDYAQRLPSRLFVFQHATSLGGVESLMEWRPMSDLHADKRLVRVSIGVEDFEDLKADILHGFASMMKDFPLEE